MMTAARGLRRAAGASPSAVERELGGYCAEAARDELRECERAENRLAAKRVLAAASCARARVRACALLGIAAERAEKLANSEVAVALTVSERIAQNYIAIGAALRDRLPLVRHAFEAGDLDHRRVDVIWRSTADIDDALLSRVEAEILAAARRLPPGRLGVEIDRLLIAADPAQAALRRKHHEAERNIRTGRSGNGMGFLEGRLTAEEIAALEAYVTELAGTVCPHDPRDRQQLRADAFVALIHGESALRCRCESKICPAAGRDEHTRRRKPHILVHVSLETLAGLADDPAVLAGFGVVDPDLARRLAADATCQFTTGDADELTGAWSATTEAAASGNSEDVGTAAPTSGDGGASAVSSDGATADSGDSGAGDDPDEFAYPPLDPDFEDFVMREHARQQHSREGLPPAAGVSRLILGRHVHARTSLGPVFGDGSLISRIEVAIAAHPELIGGRHPDGHGGHHDPPPGALTYRPSAAVARKVRARDGTCRHPGCSVSAARCQLDHIVAYDHADPRRGGWTLESNLHCLCKRHHDLKTWGLWRVSVLPGFAEHWSSVTGQTAITLPTGFRTTLYPPVPLPSVAAVDPSAAAEGRARQGECPRRSDADPTASVRSAEDESPPF